MPSDGDAAPGVNGWPTRPTTYKKAEAIYESLKKIEESNGEATAFAVLAVFITYLQYGLSLDDAWVNALEEWDLET